MNQGNILLYGTRGSDLVKFYDDSNSGIAWQLVTALWPMGDPIRDKQALKFGLEAQLSSGYAQIDAYVDSENQTSSVIQFQNSIAWINNSNTIIPWINNSNVQVGWTSPTVPGGSSYYLYRSDAKMYGKYLGLTIEGTTQPFTINGFQFEHELRARF